MSIYKNYPFTPARHSWRSKSSIEHRRILKASSPNEEIILYRALKAKLLGECHIIRQKAIFTPKSYYFADLFLKKYKIAIEVDGGYHDSKEQQIIDIDKQKHFLLRKEYKFIRITNDDINNNLEAVVNLILRSCNRAVEGKVRNNVKN